MSWWRKVGSLKLSVVLLALLFAMVLGGTLAQTVWGTGAVQTTLFSRALFEVGGWWWPGLPLVLALTGINLAAGAWVHLQRSWRHLGLWGLHATLVAFCGASLGFSLGADELSLGLLPGATADRAFVRGSDGVKSLPFSLKLTSFRIEKYPQSDEPSDYVSGVVVGGRGAPYPAEIRMNQPLRVGDWAIFQSSVQTVDGVDAPVFKLMHNPWSPFPYVFTGLLGFWILVHGLVGRRRRVP